MATIRRKLLFTVLVLSCIIVSEHQRITPNRHLLSRQKRFVFFPGSVLQLAAGLAIPAGIHDKIIYTNYGIMINYELPTNISSLLPITVIEEMRGSKSWDRLSVDLFERFGWSSSCWQKLEKWTDENKNLKRSLMYEVATIILQ
ncbi:hypothetical protein GE061_013120 [Apolygus lucorum]|uniref:Uncharacterized protein n=1 Tax=Apolygus lucorum TaxID=248454 RepID=A0A6A4J5X9_APOLU|nr:hypothetical protein GE061_013120 [Apolygus lucorum]